jgi:hypothetical protein
MRLLSVLFSESKLRRVAPVRGVRRLLDARALPRGEKDALSGATLASAIPGAGG